MEHLLENIHHPVAMVSKDNKFVYVNPAYERLVGYSQAELLGRTWMSITENEDVGGDLVGVDSISADDNRTVYTTAKHYKHKNGDVIPIALTVWRFPYAGALIGFSVEAIPASALDKIDKIHRQHTDEIEALLARVERIEALHRFVDNLAKFTVKWGPVVGIIVAAIAWLLKNFDLHWSHGP